MTRRNASLAPIANSPARPPGSRERAGSPWLGRDSVPSPAFRTFQELERQLTPKGMLPAAAIAPATSLGALADWWVHVMASPAKQWELAQYGLEQWRRAWDTATAPSGDVRPMPQDKRFADPAWRAAPYRWIAQSFLLQEQWWQRAMTAVPGVSRRHEAMMSFAARQWLDMVAPSNFVSTNPVVQRRTVQEGGANLLRGAAHTLEDAWRSAADKPPAAAQEFEVGRNVAATPGRVVLRNRLIELIQYEPTTRTVHAEPVLIVPAWIMKYYVLDLSANNSMVKYLVDQGFTVFMISWKNPDADDRDLGMDDYEHLGVEAALQAIRSIVPGARVHAAGYCLGGTLLAIAAAGLGRREDHSLQTVTLMAAQTDFSDPGELALFIDEGQVALLEGLMAQRGYLDKHQMAGAFQMLRSNDLIWSYRLTNQLLGERRPMTDLAAWNADGTRLPLRMHSEYLRGLFLNNALARGEWMVDGQPVNLRDIRVPVFSVGTVQDHVAPWRSVFKLHALTDTEQTFVLTAGGHNVGIVNPPGSALSSYRLRQWHHGERLLSPDEWLAQTPSVAGSWWGAWADWLKRRSSRKTRPPSLGAPDAGLPALEAAPGSYVRQR